MRFKYVCSDCGREYSGDRVMYHCPECEKKNSEREFDRGVLEIRLSDEALKEAGKKEHVSAKDFSPYEYDESLERAYPVGNTPLMAPMRLRERLGLENLYLKLDSQLISGSFKDRASFMALVQAKSMNEEKIVLASTGNAGAAMSAIGAAFGVKIVLFVPKSAPKSKLMQSYIYGAEVKEVDGSYDDAFRMSIAYTKEHGGINRNTAYNPITIEGKKSVSIELFEELGRKAPDIVYVPVGDGCIISGVIKGFKDLRDAGLIERLPRVICAQSERSAAISNALERGDYSPIKPTTRADSISVGLPAAGRIAVKLIKEANGWSTRVKDEEIFSSQKELGELSGVLAEPAAATSYAALKKDLERIKREFGNDKTIVVLITGTGFKDMESFNKSLNPNRI